MGFLGFVVLAIVEERERGVGVYVFLCFRVFGFTWDAFEAQILKYR